MTDVRKLKSINLCINTVNIINFSYLLLTSKKNKRKKKYLNRKV